MSYLFIHSEIVAFLKKKQIRFSSADDIKLPKDVVSQNPSLSKDWKAVADAVSDAVEKEIFIIDARRARGNMTLLIDQFKKENRQALKRYVLLRKKEHIFLIYIYIIIVSVELTNILRIYHAIRTIKQTHCDIFTEF